MGESCREFELVSPGDGAWADQSIGFAAGADYGADRPAGIALCQDSAAVCDAVAYALEHGMKVRPRSGRHDFEGRSSRVRDGLIVDLRGLSYFEPAGSGEVWVGPGTNMAELIQELDAAGTAMPYATAGTVGVGGFLLGGGLGMSMRLWGLATRHVTGFEIVLADGTAREVTAESDSDLFWAVLGGGPGFGVVTRFRIRPQRVDRVGVIQINWPWIELESVVDRWQRSVGEQPPELTTMLRLTIDGKLQLTGQWTGDGDHPELLTSALQHLGGGPKFRSLSHLEAALEFFGVTERCPLGWHANLGSQLFKSTSSFAYEPLPASAIRLIRTALEQHPKLLVASSQPSMVQLLGGQGAPLDDRTCTPHSAARFLVQYDGYWSIPQDREPIRGWVRKLRQEMLPFTEGAFCNYTDDDLQDPEKAYFGEHVERLAAIKKRVDPLRLFS